MITLQDTKDFVDDILDALPFRRQKTIFSPFVVGAIGVAVMGGIAALMIWSPRTRYRVLGAAKETYGKALEKTGLQHRDDATTQPNGLVGSSSYGNGISTGL